MLVLLKILIKRIQVVGLLIGVLVLNACSDREKNSSLIFEELNESLERSNEILGNDINISLAYLEELTKRPETAEKGKVLLPKAKLINSYSSNILRQIDSLSNEIKNKLKVDSELIKQGGATFVKELFIKQKRGDELYKKLIQFNNQVLNIDERIKNEFGETLPINNRKFKMQFPNKEKFTEIYFGNTSISQSAAVLSKLRNDILTTENETILFLRNSICIIGLVYDTK